MLSHLTALDGLELLSALAGSGMAGALLKHWIERRRESATVEKITAEAHNQIYRAYGELLDDLRQDAGSARSEAMAARKAAWAAESRAGEAEARASAAESRAAAAEARAASVEALVAEIRALVGKHPDAEELLKQIDTIWERRRTHNDT